MPNRKSWIEIIIVPLVIAIVGVVGTFLVTRQQQRSSEILERAQLETTTKMAVADRQIKIIDIFSEKIASDDPEDQKFALALLEVLDPELAEKLANAVTQGRPESQEVRQIAAKAVTQAVFRSVAGSYMMDKQPGRIITVTHEGGGNYRIEDNDPRWPWTGTAKLQGKRLVGTGTFTKSRATMDIEGTVNPNGTISVAYKFKTDSKGNPSKRVDRHVWSSAMVGQ